MQFFLTLYPLAFVFLAQNVSGEVFTALVDMENLLESEKMLLEVLHNFIQATENNLDLLKRYFEEFNAHHKQAEGGIQKYLENPINAYQMTKRLTSDWKDVQSIMTDEYGKELLKYLESLSSEHNFILPTGEDLNGAAAAITRLQTTYKLKTSSLAKGEINGVESHSRLSAGDCLELCKQSHLNEDFHYGDSWGREALFRYYKEVNKTANLVDILENIAYSSYMLGDLPQALQITKKILKLDPQHERALDNIKFFGEFQQNPENKTQIKKKTPFVTGCYEKLCRKEYTLTEKQKSSLRCRYVDFGRPFLKLARVKEEEAYLDPRIVIYHDIIYDKEIDAIKTLSIPKFTRATVQNPETGGRDIASYRISKTAWLYESLHPRLASVSRRVADVTGLNLLASEDFQVVNYGIGGHYETHYDFTQEGENPTDFVRIKGERIATFLFYISDVDQGGATVFPALNLSVWPQKGTGVLWYNLFKSGRGDIRTLHGACPVLMGSKWVCTKWILTKGQEFLRRCGLTEDGFLWPNKTKKH